MALGSLLLTVLAPVWVWPLDPTPSVVHGFDPPAVAWGAGHRGVDLAGTESELVRAAGPGRVAFAGPVAGTPVVVVDHGTRRTTYEPVAPLVQVGAEVAAGEAIGRLQLGDSHCFPDVCLHWGLVDNADGGYLDPLSLLGPREVRLLPTTPD